MNAGIRRPVGLCLGMLTADRLMNLRQRLEKGEDIDKMFLAVIGVLESIVEDFLCFKQGIENRLDAEDNLRRQKKILSELYSNYDTKDHDAFMFRFSLEAWQRMKDNGEEIPKHVDERLREAENAEKADL